jgi:hypothetical protein
MGDDRMIRRVIVVVGSVLLLCGSDVRADERAAPLREPKAVAEAFLAGIRDGKIEAAYDGLLIGSPIPEQAQQYVLLKGQTQSQMQLFGTALDYECLQQKEIGKSLLVLKYVLRYEKDAITWTLVFYRPKDQWIVTALKYLPSTQYLSE